MLHGRVAVHDEDRLAELLERPDEGVVFTENHLVVQLAVDPSFHDALDVGEIADHVAAIERTRPDFNLRDGVVSVGVLADAVVVEEAMTVAEFDFLGD
jgi:hypothetical protein